MRTLSIAAFLFALLIGGPDLEPLEDSPFWDCRHHGNQVCGPGNDTGVTPGWYENGQLIARW